MDNCSVPANGEDSVDGGVVKKPGKLPRLQKQKLELVEIPSPVVGRRYPKQAVNELVEFIFYDEIAASPCEEGTDEVDGPVRRGEIKVRRNFNLKTLIA